MLSPGEKGCHSASRSGRGTLEDTSEISLWRHRRAGERKGLCLIKRKDIYTICFPPDEHGGVEKKNRENKEENAESNIKEKPQEAMCS